MTQTAMILAHLKSGNSITQADATALFGCTRLAARIHDLRCAGHKISEERIEVRNRFGKQCKISRYSLDVGRRHPHLLFDLPHLVETR